MTTEIKVGKVLGIEYACRNCYYVWHATHGKGVDVVEIDDYTSLKTTNPASGGTISNKVMCPHCETYRVRVIKRKRLIETLAEKHSEENV